MPSTCMRVDVHASVCVQVVEAALKDPRGPAAQGALYGVTCQLLLRIAEELKDRLTTYATVSAYTHTRTCIHTHTHTHTHLAVLDEPLHVNAQTWQASRHSMHGRLATVR